MARKELSDEAEWEFTGRCGPERMDFTWDMRTHILSNTQPINTWQGEFHYQNLLVINMNALFGLN